MHHLKTIRLWKNMIFWWSLEKQEKFPDLLFYILPEERIFLRILSLFPFIKEINKLYRQQSYIDKLQLKAPHLLRKSLNET